MDAHVGQRVRVRRTLLGLSQEKLGEAIGLTFQQVQKYERGANRISAGTLYRLGQVLDVPVSFFFDGYEDPHAKSRSAAASTDAHSETGISRREARLLRLWRAAPLHIADEMLSLLSVLSPSDGEAVESPDGEAAEAPAQAPAVVTVAAPPKAGTSRRQRRRHGAVWDPADIYRTSKADA